MRPSLKLHVIIAGAAATVAAIAGSAVGAGSIGVDATTLIGVAHPKRNSTRTRFGGFLFALQGSAFGREQTMN